MKKHPNDFTRQKILKYFADRRMEVEVRKVENGYVIFFHRFSPFEDCTINDPAGRLIYDQGQDFWTLYWMSGRFRWHIYDRYPKMHLALEEMISDRAANLFVKVL